MTNARKARGMRTQAALAERWKEIGLFPWATDAGPGRSGNDVLNTPGLNVEVKAHGESLSIPAALRQCRAGGTKWWRSILIWRHNGQGEKSMAEWSVSMSLADFEAYERDRQKLRALEQE